MRPVVSETRPDAFRYRIRGHAAPMFPPPEQQPNAGTQLVESGVLAVNYNNPDTGQREFGGNITGLAFVGGRLFGVTDKGHLYTISGQDGPAPVPAMWQRSKMRPARGSTSRD